MDPTSWTVLLTGSRTYTDYPGMAARLNRQTAHAHTLGRARLVLRHGACYPRPGPGGVRPTISADWLAHLWAARVAHPLPVHETPMPARWDQPCTPACTHRPRPPGHGCPAAGPIRNAAMVALGADIGMAFIVGHSRGATGTRDMMRAAGIPLDDDPPGPAPR